MKDLAAGLWERAQKALLVARTVLSLDADAAANRAYYAAFHAVSAHFAMTGQTFTRHSAVEAAVHRDLVKAGRWSKDLGASYSMLVALRETGDYGDMAHVSDAEAAEAVGVAEHILRAVARAHDFEVNGSSD